MKFKVCIIRPLLPPTPVSFKLPFSLKPEDCKYLRGRLRAISTTSLTACLHGHKIKTFQRYFTKEISYYHCFIHKFPEFVYSPESPPPE